MNSAFSNQFASYLLKLLSGIIAFKILHNNTSKNVEDAADDVDVDVDIDALVLTISLVLISSHCCLFFFRITIQTRLMI